MGSEAVGALLMGRMLAAGGHHRHRHHHAADLNLTMAVVEGIASDDAGSFSSRSQAALKFVHEHGGSWILPDGGRYSAPPRRSCHPARPAASRSPAASKSHPSRALASLAALAVESVLLVVAFKACLVMWCIARHTQKPGASGEYSAVGASDAMVEASHEATYRRLRNLYLSVYGLATFGDWIQGGFLYALYAEYGYSMRAVSLIFVVGYASAATIGTYVAALGDLGGHRRNCVAYGILYAISCALCNFQSLWALLLGRMLGGIAYSILYTSFESWLIAEADARRLPMTLLSRLFSVATFTNAVSRPQRLPTRARARASLARTRVPLYAPSPLPFCALIASTFLPPCPHRARPSSLA